MIVALILVVILLFVSNAAWLYCWMQYDYGTETVTDTYSVDMDADGIATYIGQDGDVNYGTYPSSED